MPKRMYDMLELKPFDPCSFGVRLVDSFEPSCPIIFGRSFLHIVGAIIDMK